jgi:hypothetical protein
MRIAAPRSSDVGAPATPLQRLEVGTTVCLPQAISLSDVAADAVTCQLTG